MSSPVQIAVATVELASVPRILWPRLELILSEDERARATRFHFERNWREYVAAHALKRLVLCEAAGGRPGDWEFAVEDGGKPIVAGGIGPHFNLSHCDGLVVCAVSSEVPVGVDVEPFGRRTPLEIAEDYFAEKERSWLFGLSESERSLGFYRLWTMKEAILKATGRGLAEDLQAFSIAFDPLRVTFADPARNVLPPWQLVQRTIGVGHLLGLAWCGPEATVSIRPARLEDMTRSAGSR